MTKKLPQKKPKRQTADEFTAQKVARTLIEETPFQRKALAEAKKKLIKHFAPKKKKKKPSKKKGN